MMWTYQACVCTVATSPRSVGCLLTRRVLLARRAESLRRTDELKRLSEIDDNEYLVMEEGGESGQRRNQLVIMGSKCQRVSLLINATRGNKVAPLVDHPL
eukprot:1196288-Prorocentrum_minimum.AAC.3